MLSPKGKVAYWMHLAVADGPNHSPGCFPQAEAPCSTKRCIEKGAIGSSAKSDSILRSSSCLRPGRQSVFCLMEDNLMIREGQTSTKA